MINKVILIGRLGADAEVKQTSKGDSMASMSLATNKKFKDEEKLHGTKLLYSILVLQIQWASMLKQVLCYISKVK